MAIDGPEFLKPRLRLFLSADIVGSTALKQTPLAATSDDILEQHSLWFTVIQGFYVEAAEAFATEWQRCQEKWNSEPLWFGPPPRLWKTVGDEVLFEKVVTDHRQISVVLMCWTLALEKMRCFLKENGRRLDVKSTAWLAGFPVVNKEVVLNFAKTSQPSNPDSYFTDAGKLLNSYYEDTESSLVRVDYVGPAIDTGFRLTGYASARRLSISVGVAYALSKTVSTSAGPIKEFRVMFGGSTQLKGVLGGLNYPLFWIDLSDDGSLARCEDGLSGLSKTTKSDVQAYCEAFYDENGAYAFVPFIDLETEQQLKDRPAWYDGILIKMKKTFAAELSSLDLSVEADVERESPGKNLSRKEVREDSAGVADLIKK